METSYTFTREEGIICFKKWVINVIENPDLYEASQIKDGDNYIEIGKKIHVDAEEMADAFIRFLTEKEMRHIVLLRTEQNEVAVYGLLFVVQDSRILHSSKTIENRGKLCAAGVYDLKYEYSPKFERNLWELKGVPGRSEIKIHVANYWQQLEGCIGVGQRHADINSDGVIDVASSALALKDLHTTMGDLKESRISIFDVT